MVGVYFVCVVVFEYDHGHVAEVDGFLNRCAVLCVFADGLTRFVVCEAGDGVLVRYVVYLVLDTNKILDVCFAVLITVCVVGGGLVAQDHLHDDVVVLLGDLAVSIGVAGAGVVVVGGGDGFLDALAESVVGVVVGVVYAD